MAQTDDPSLNLNGRGYNNLYLIVDFHFTVLINKQTGNIFSKIFLFVGYKLDSFSLQGSWSWLPQAFLVA